MWPHQQFKEIFYLIPDVNDSFVHILCQSDKTLTFSKLPTTHEKHTCSKSDHVKLRWRFQGKELFGGQSPHAYNGIIECTSKKGGVFRDTQTIQSRQ